MGYERARKAIALGWSFGANSDREKIDLTKVRQKYGVVFCKSTSVVVLFQCRDQSQHK